MNQNPKRKGFVGVGALILLGAVIVGLFGAPRILGSRMTQTMAVSETTSESGTRDPMEGMTSMKEMQSVAGKSAASPMAVTIPAVTRQLIGIRTVQVTYAKLEQEIRTVGTVEYNERGFSQVALKIPGWVREVFVNSIGRPVRKGEPLFTMYSPDLLTTQDEYLLAVKTQAQLADSPLPDAKTNAQALVASARERLRLWDVTDSQIEALERRGTSEPVLTVYAPSSGIVQKREALPGKYVEPGTPLYEIADLSTVWIQAAIYESEVSATKLGQPATVVLSAYPGETFQGKVAYVYPTVNTEARTVRVRLEFSNPGFKLKPGMYGTATLVTSSSQTLVVPKEAVLETGLRQLVFMDRGEGRYEPASVKLGRRSQDKVEVIEGLKEGDWIVASANFFLDAESKLASASSMQGMMGRVGMADWQMRGAHEGKMDGMGGKQGMERMHGMQGMENMPGMKTEEMKGMEGMPGSMTSNVAKAVSETRHVAGVVLLFTTSPEPPKVGEVLLRLKVTDQTGKPVTNADVTFVYTMPMPGMADSKAMARHNAEGLYEGKVLFGMGGTWMVTAKVTIPGRPSVIEQFQFVVAS